MFYNILFFVVIDIVYFMFEFIVIVVFSINVFILVKCVVVFNVLVFIQGEIGVGKECVVKYIYIVVFGENDNVFYIGVNCVVILENMLEVILFGYDKGVFIGVIVSVSGKMELVNNGILLFDEIGDMLLVLQVKILCVLQEQLVE